MLVKSKLRRNLKTDHSPPLPHVMPPEENRGMRFRRLAKPLFDCR
jgi:hypothetical protein